MGLLDHLANLIGFRKKKINILVIGLNNSGKSTIINYLKREDEQCIDIMPTVGYSLEKFISFDMSGHDRYRSLWEHYYKDCQAIIFLLDSSDKLRMVVVKEEINIFLQHPDIIGRNLPILFLANKMDLTTSLSIVNLISYLGLNKIQNKSWHVQATNAISGEGIQIAIEWLVEQMQDKIHHNKK